MTLVILLFSIGIVLVALEVIVPGGLLGAIGGLLMFGGCVMSFMEFGTTGGIVSLALAFSVATIALFIELKILPKPRLGKRAFLSKQITAVSRAVPAEAAQLIGKNAEATTLLSPSGYVTVDGRRYEAFCQSGQAPVGAALKIIGADNFRLIVSQSTNH